MPRRGAGYRGEVERCPECQRNPGEFRPWPVYTVRLNDGVERCARCLRALNPSLDPVDAPPPVVLEPQTQIFQLETVVWPTAVLEPDWLRRQSSCTAQAGLTIHGL